MNRTSCVQKKHHNHNNKNSHSMILYCNDIQLSKSMYVYIYSIYLIFNDPNIISYIVGDPTSIVIDLVVGTVRGEKQLTQFLSRARHRRRWAVWDDPETGLETSLFHVRVSMGISMGIWIKDIYTQITWTWSIIL